MTDHPDEDQDLPRLRQLSEELRKLRVGDTPDEILERTRLDIWSPSAPVGSTAEVEEFLDPVTGGRVRSTLFQASAVAPVDYPADWPFVVEQDAQHVRIETGSESLTTLMWSEPTNPETLLQWVRDSMAALGWHEHDVEGPSTDPRYHHVTWFHCIEQPDGHQWRLLAVGADNGLSGIVLSEVRSEMWPRSAEPS